MASLAEKIAEIANEEAAAADLTEAAAPRPTPSWFPPAADVSVEDLAERYRLREHDRQAGQRRAATAARPRGRPAFEREEEEVRMVRSAVPVRRRSNTLGLVAAGVAAMLMGGVTGYAMSHLQQLSATWTAFAARVSPPLQAAAAGTPAPAAAPAPKLISTATLRVADAKGALNEAIPLQLRAEPPAGGEDIVLKVAGLPQDAYLTAGTRLGPSDWLLEPAQAEAVKVVVPHAELPAYDLSVAAVGKTSGELAAPVKEVTLAIANPDRATAVAPLAPAVPETAPAATEMAAAAPMAEAPPALHVSPAPVPVTGQITVTPAAAPEGSADLVAKGNQLLEAGDMAAARAFFERAFALGAPDGALGLARTYDPVVYANLKVQGLSPDSGQALAWYRKAAIAGSPEATAAMAALQSASQ